MKRLSLILIYILAAYFFAGIQYSCGGDGMLPPSIPVEPKPGGNGGDGEEPGGPEEPGKPEEPKPPTGIDGKEVLALLNKVADWQIANHSYSTSGNLHDNGINSWTHGTLYNGMAEWTLVAPDSRKYTDWLRGIGVKAGWKLPANFVNQSYSLYHADELCIGQFYLTMWEWYNYTEAYDEVKGRVDWIMANPPSENMAAWVKQSWTWCDALYMAPPVYARLAFLENDDSYLEFMHLLYKRTYDYLYDSEEGLFYRDDTYFGSRETNGRKVFWGRGNGWVAAGLVGILKQDLPVSSLPHLRFYEELFREFVPRLAELQDSEGFWHASLLDPSSYPAPETSASAMITYAIAYGINEGLLDKEIYLPIVEKAWKALTTVVADNGKVGYVQPIGQDPKQVTKDMTAVYGVGAFLMAGSEVYRLVE